MWRYLSGGRTVYRYRRAHRDAGRHRRRSSIGDNYAPSLERRRRRHRHRRHDYGC